MEYISSDNLLFLNSFMRGKATLNRERKKILFSTLKEISENGNDLELLISPFTFDWKTSSCYMIFKRKFELSEIRIVRLNGQSSSVNNFTCYKMIGMNVISDKFYSLRNKEDYDFIISNQYVFDKYNKITLKCQYVFFKDIGILIFRGSDFSKDVDLSLRERKRTREECLNVRISYLDDLLKLNDVYLSLPITLFCYFLYIKVDSGGYEKRNIEHTSFELDVYLINRYEMLTGMRIEGVDGMMLNISSLSDLMELLKSGHKYFLNEDEILYKLNKFYILK